MSFSGGSGCLCPSPNLDPRNHQVHFASGFLGLGPECAGVCMHTDLNGAKGEEPGAEGGS